MKILGLLLAIVITAAVVLAATAVANPCQEGFSWKAAGVNNPNGLCISSSGAVMAPITHSVGHVADPNVITNESTLGQAIDALKGTGAELTSP